MIKITPKVLSLPPYISTSWNHVAGIHTHENILYISLTSGNIIQIENLDSHIIDSIFSVHSVYLENQDTPTLPSHISSSPLIGPHIETPFQFAFGPAGSGIHQMEHNPAFADAPELPAEVLDKISEIARIVAPEDTINLPEAQPDCNCPHCQVARAIGKNTQPSFDAKEEKPEEEAIEVQDEELNFQQWEIKQIGNQLFQAKNRLDDTEIYQIYLGDPIGCTCGQPGCEHIPAVLKS